MTSWRNRVAGLVDHHCFTRGITGLIALNAALLGLETVPSVMAVWGNLIVALDEIILAVFVVELTLRMIAHGKAFWRDPWSLFDTTIVGVALMPESGTFSVLRALRVLRVLRLVSSMPRLRRVVETLLRAIPGMGSIALLMMLLFYVFSVMATKLFGSSFDAWFGTIGRSMYSLFQIMTLESWSMGIVRPVMEVYPWAWAFFVTFILIASFTILNLFIAVIVDSMQRLHLEEQDVMARGAEEQAHTEREQLRQDINGLREEIRSLRGDLSTGRSPERET